MNKVLVVALLSFLGISLKAQVGRNVSLKSVFHIASAGGLDYLAISPAHDWLYVSHGTQVNILNKTTGDSVGVLLNTAGVHGIAFDVLHEKGYTSNGMLNAVTVFNLHTNAPIAQIKTGLNPDAIFYEEFSKKIITCNGRGKNLSIIDPINDVVVDSIDVGGKPETAVSDGLGHLFVNIEDRNEVVQIDVKTFKIMNRWSIAPAEGPTGLAYDKTTQRLFVGCAKMLVVLNAKTGTIVSKIPIGDGCDGVAFDSETKMIYTSNGEGTMSMIHAKSADTYRFVGNVNTKRGARTITLDAQTHKIYLPTADLEPQAAGAKGRPKMIPGTFQVLVFGE